MTRGKHKWVLPEDSSGQGTAIAQGGEQHRRAISNLVSDVAERNCCFSKQGEVSSFFSCCSQAGAASQGTRCSREWRQRHALRCSTSLRAGSSERFITRWAPPCSKICSSIKKFGLWRYWPLQLWAGTLNERDIHRSVCNSLLNLKPQHGLLSLPALTAFSSCSRHWCHPNTRLQLPPHPTRSWWLPQSEAVLSCFSCHLPCPQGRDCNPNSSQTGKLSLR